MPIVLHRRLFWAIPIVLLFLVGLASLLADVHDPEENDDTTPIVAGDVAWVLTSTALVLLMTPGLAFFYGGMVQPKNLISTLMQSYASLGVITVVWFAFGFSLAFGEDCGHFIGNPKTYYLYRGVAGQTDSALSPTIPLAVFAMFQLKFAIITPALTVGAFAERIRFSSYLLFCTLFCIFVYCPIAHWVWHPDGFLRKWDVLDFAGGAAVHMSSGYAALAGALVIGRRKLHFEGRKHTPAVIPYVLLGSGLLWFGWFGFNSGSALAANDVAALSLMTTNTASAAGMLTWIFLDASLGEKPSAMGAATGIVAGLVGITPGAGFVDIGSSLLIGMITAIVCNISMRLFAKLPIDDALSVFPCHGMGGTTGMVLTAVFATDNGVIHNHGKLLGYHLLAMLIVAVYSFCVSFALYKITDLIIPMRVSPDEEEVGLDISDHGESIISNAITGNHNPGKGMESATGSLKDDKEIPTGKLIKRSSKRNDGSVITNRSDLSRVDHAIE